MSRLEELVRETEQETAARRQRVPLAELKAQAAQTPPPRSLAAALRGPGLRVIAEMKASSPSAGALATGYDPAQLARTYVAGGAAALSVLAQRTSFGGSPDHIAEVRRATSLPILRKDFITDEYQVVEARVLGADAILLIVAALNPGRLARLREVACGLGLETLVEIHDEAEVEIALEVGSELIGVNHRDLRTLTIDLDLSRRLRPQIPAGRVFVAESGIKGPEDARRLLDLGVDAILVGESLMRSSDPARLIRELSLQ